MKEFIVSDHQVLCSPDGRVWVTSPAGETIGRFDPKMGIDVHHTLEAQQRLGHQCLDCRHEPVGIEVFIQSMREHYDLDLGFLEKFSR